MEQRMEAGPSALSPAPSAPVDDPALELVLRDAHKVYAPTELGGMMGYLTAVEEYLSRREGVALDQRSLLDAAKRLNDAGFEATARVKGSGFRETFEEAVERHYGGTRD